MKMKISEEGWKWAEQRRSIMPRPTTAERRQASVTGTCKVLMGTRYMVVLCRGIDVMLVVLVRR
jgi:hypothetical protein